MEFGEKVGGVPCAHVLLTHALLCISASLQTAAYTPELPHKQTWNIVELGKTIVLSMGLNCSQGKSWIGMK